MKIACFCKKLSFKLKVRKLKVLNLAAIMMSIFIISQTVFASGIQSDNYIPLGASNVIPLLSQSDVIKTHDVEPDKQLNITIGLKFRNKDQLQQKIKSVHAQGKFLRPTSDQDMDTNFLPDKNAHNKVVEFLKNNGLKITKTYSSRMVIQASGSVQDIENAFKVKLSYFSHNGIEFFANSTEPEFPSDIAGLVENISGLNNLKLEPSLQNEKFVYSNSVNMSSFTPQEIQKAYNFTSAYDNNINGEGVKLAIATYNSFNQSDITHFINNFGITGTKPLSVIPVDGIPQYDEFGSAETSLDIECALSSAPGAQILVYDGANPYLSTQIDLFTQIVNDGQADIVSYSWGNDEASYSEAEINEMHNLIIAGVAKGMTFLVASGDSGSEYISYPATDPYVTAVGGTTLSVNSSSGQISSESAWSIDSNGDGSGGGSSSLFSTPTWQQGISSLNTGHRMIPDVSLNANPSTGYEIYFNGNWILAGGTSAATPEWAAIFALVNQSRNNNGLGNIGLANPDLYSLSKESVFNDVTSGSNGKYSCLPGYDMVTGLGSVDAWKLVNKLSNLEAQYYAVTYNGNGNSGGSVPVNSNLYTVGATIPVSSNTGNLVKTGYTFAGWNTAADGSGIDYTPNSTFILGTSNVTLYAKWKVPAPALGCLDRPTNGSTISGANMLSGWFLDGSGVNKVEVLVDGKVVGTAVYGDSRNDVARVFPSYNTSNSGYHYSLDTTKLTNGKHIIVIRETGNNNTQTSLKGITVTVSNIPLGCLDSPTNGSTISGAAMIKGWFLDGSGVNKVEVLVDGKVAGTAIYGDSRMDVAKVFPSYNTSNSGYHYSLDTTKLTNGKHTIVIRETGNNNTQTSLKGITVTVSNIPLGCLDSPTNGSTISGAAMIKGWFLDGSGVNKVEVLVDGKVAGTAVYGDSRMDVAKVFPSYNTSNSGYHYSLDTTKLTNGKHIIVIRETGNNNTQTSLKGITVTVSNIPLGCLDRPTNGSTISGAAMLSGWFLDGSGVNKVEVLVDGKVVGTAVYGDSRNDVARVFPSYNTSNSGYHYSLDTTKLTNGKHTIVIRETGNNNMQTSLKGITVTVSNIPLGCLDRPTNGSTISGAAMLSGWFLDGSGVNKVEVLVDGKVAGTAVYGDSRNDVARVFPSYNTSNSGYHYSLDTTKLTNGKHTIVIRETGNNNMQTSLKGITVTVSNG